ncbi:uncharacterized protein LOC121368263 isoform X2 [Gigantopelta aegis]|uniref:uncharacterized protein LOC121368263 isoform X2 n=1 Tax=Gigantopelta aegis TaxID=1735272 RepID=UPI001B88C7B7|nr:uncharacterized protein LOC121368263 isoform X2 [Gigantopelta aegis]
MRMLFLHPNKNSTSDIHIVLWKVLCWLFALYLFCVIVLAVPVSSKGRICTKLVPQTKVIPKQSTKLCNQSYQAHCGWFTREMCTFYEQVECEEVKNITKLVPKIVYVCCPGWVQLSNQSCIREEDAGIFYKDNTTQIHIVYEGDPEKHSEVYEDEDISELSSGAFAAVACAGLFILCVAIVIAIHVRKRQKRLQKEAEMENITMEEQKMVLS